MNRHPGLLSPNLLRGILILSMMTASLSRAQTTQPGAISDAEKSSTSPNIQAIDAFVAGQIPALAGTDAAARGVARDALIDAVSPPRQGVLQPRFLDDYARLLNEKIIPVLGTDTQAVRLNAAIVVARVAEKADNLMLRPAVLKVLADKSPFVALWGIKGVRGILPAAIRNPVLKGDEGLDGIVKAVGAHGSGPLGGPIVLESYATIVLDVTNSDAKRRASDKMITTVIPVIHQVLQQRIASYRNGIPPEPLAERDPTRFLTLGRVWALHTDAQRVTSMQLMSDLVGLAAQHVAPAAGINAEKLKMIIAHIAAALTVTPEVDTTPAIKDKLALATRIVPNMTAANVAEAVAPIFEALKSHKSFAALTPPPAIAAATAGAGGDKEIVETTQPASSSATAPSTGPAGSAIAQPKATPSPGPAAPPRATGGSTAPSASPAPGASPASGAPLRPGEPSARPTAPTPPAR